MAREISREEFEAIFGIDLPEPAYQPPAWAPYLARAVSFALHTPPLAFRMICARAGMARSELAS